MVGMTRTLDVVGCNRNIEIVQLCLSSASNTTILLFHEYMKQA